MTPLGRLEDAAELLVLQRAAGSKRGAGQRVVGDGDGETGFVAQDLVQPLQQGTTSGEDDALVADVGGKLRRRVLESDSHALDDGSDGLGQRLCDLALVDGDFLRNAVHEVATLD